MNSWKWSDPEDKTVDGVTKMLKNYDVWCEKCKHIHKNRVTCDAFEDGIPTKILTGDVRHDKPYPGDRGIQFEPK